VYKTIHVLDYNDRLYFGLKAQPDFPATSTERDRETFCCYRLLPAQYDGPGLAAAIQDAFTKAQLDGDPPTVSYSYADGSLHIAVVPGSPIYALRGLYHGRADRPGLAAAPVELGRKQPCVRPRQPAAGARGS
jgi:hypothetical protein